MQDKKDATKFLSSVVILVILLVFGLNLGFGQTGKIAGRVTDVDTGDPLVGANVVVEGLLLGASTDSDGFYFILNMCRSLMLIY